MTHIFVGIPTMGWHMTNEVAAFCAVLDRFDNANAKYRFTIQTRNNFAPTEYARNVLAADFMETDAEWLWFVDSDTRPSPNSLDLLLHLDDYDILAGLVPMLKEQRLAFPIFEEVEGGWQTAALPADGSVVPCDAVTPKCMLIHRRVLTDPRMGTDLSDGLPAHFRWSRESNGRSLMGEDMDFCQRARAAGFRIGCHTGVQWGHVESVDLLVVADIARRAFDEGYRAGQAPRIVVTG